MHTRKEVLADALNLSPIERAQLVEDLLTSFEFPDRDRLDRLWAAEAEERIDAYERGELAAVPLDSVFEKINTWKK